MPRPMPSGVDIADAMHVDTEAANIIASTGLRRFFCQSGEDLISFANQTPSVAIASRMAAMARSGRGMSWRQSRVMTRSTSPVAGRSSPPTRCSDTLARPAKRSLAAAMARSETS